MPGGAGAIASMTIAARKNQDALAVLASEDWLEEAKAVTVDRLAMLSVLKRRSQRARHFRSAPIALAFFMIFLAAIVLRRGTVSDTFSFEKQCVYFLFFECSFGAQFRTRIPSIPRDPSRSSIT